MQGGAEGLGCFSLHRGGGPAEKPGKSLPVREKGFLRLSCCRLRFRLNPPKRRRYCMGVIPTLRRNRRPKKAASSYPTSYDLLSAAGLFGAVHRRRGRQPGGFLTVPAVLLGSVEDDVVHCFRQGGGVPYERYARFHDVMAEDSGQTVLPSLFDAILPLAPGLTERLDRGIEVHRLPHDIQNDYWVLHPYILGPVNTIGVAAAGAPFFVLQGAASAV